MKCLITDNLDKSKTKHIEFESFKIRPYLIQNENTSLSKTIFCDRSGTLDIKVWNEWNYEVNLCLMCSLVEENIDQLMTCSTYGKVAWEINWKEIFFKQCEKSKLCGKRCKKKTIY